VAGKIEEFRKLLAEKQAMVQAAVPVSDK